MSETTFNCKAWHRARNKSSGRTIIIKCIAARLNVPLDVAECALHGFVVYPAKAERRNINELLKVSK